MLRKFRDVRQTVVFALTSLAALFVLAVAFSGSGPAKAQDVSPDVIRALRGSGTTSGSSDDSNRPTIQTYQPVQPQGAPPADKLETLYSQRAGRPLTQIGYGVVGVPATISVGQAGAASDSYVLGVGDELTFELRGQENASYRQRVDRDGRIVLPKLNPILAAGQEYGEFRAAVEAEVNRAYVGTKVFVSLGQVRQVSVLVTGYVRTPGTRIVSALASPLDAILLSGGIEKSGSLRNILIIRNGTVRVIDLYSVILKGSAVHLGSLQDGDRIYVAPLGATVAIAGSVRLPGIFELPVGARATNVDVLMSLAGGAIIPNAYDISKIILHKNGETTLEPVSKNAVVDSGEIVFVDPSRTANVGRVDISGAVQEPTTKPLSMVRTTDELFSGVSDLSPSAYTPLALIVRRDPMTNASSLIAFSLSKSLAHSARLPLQSDDHVYVLDQSDLRAICEYVTKDMNTPFTPSATPEPVPATGTRPTIAPQSAVSPTAPAASPAVPNGGNASGALSAPGGGANAPAVYDPRGEGAYNSAEGAALAEARALARSSLGDNAHPATPPPETDAAIVDRVAHALSVPREMLLHVLADHLVWVLDQVNVPGPIAVAEGTSLPEVIAAAGGALTQADLSAIQVTSTSIDRQLGTSKTWRNLYSAADTNFGSVLVGPLDVIRIRQVYSDRVVGTMTIAGEVRYPGLFDITREERLSSVLQRAGGITEAGYPYGAVFTRRSAAILEREGHERSARELQSSLVDVLASASNQQQGGTSIAAVQYLSTLVDAVRTEPTLGRIAVTADPVVLASRPDLDLILEPGDSLYIPKRPATVTISGEVLNPGSFQFRASLDFDDYIRAAGGATKDADEGRAFVVMPDGSAMPTHDSWIAFGTGGHIPPGSTIVVPRDLRPFEWAQFLKDATQIVSQLAVSAASLAVLGNN